jgi:hypothetical protein
MERNDDLRKAPFFLKIVTSKNKFGHDGHVG